MLPLFPGEESSLRPSSPHMDIIYSAAFNLNSSLKFLKHDSRRQVINECSNLLQSSGPLEQHKITQCRKVNISFYAKI